MLYYNCHNGNHPDGLGVYWYREQASWPGDWYRLPEPEPAFLFTCSFPRPSSRAQRGWRCRFLFSTQPTNHRGRPARLQSRSALLPAAKRLSSAPTQQRRSRQVNPATGGDDETRLRFFEAFVSQFDDLAWGVYEGE